MFEHFNAVEKFKSRPIHFLIQVGYLGCSSWGWYFELIEEEVSTYIIIYIKKT